MSTVGSCREQHPLVYNRLLPLFPSSSSIDVEASAYLAHIESGLKSACSVFDLKDINEVLYDLDSYIFLYGYKFSYEQHVYYIQVAYELIQSEHIDCISLETPLKLLVTLLKKKHLLPNFKLDWKPLYNLLKTWMDSSRRRLFSVKPSEEMEQQLKKLMAIAHEYYDEQSTQEILNEFRPLLYPFGAGISKAFNRLALLLPTHASLAPSSSYLLWLGEFLSIFDAFANRAYFESDLFSLISRLSYNQTGLIEWSNHRLESIYSRMFKALGVPISFGSSGLVSGGLSADTSHQAMAAFAVATYNGGGSVYLHRLLQSLEFYFHPSSSSFQSSDAMHAFVSSLCTCFVERLHLERYSTKNKCYTPMEKRLRDNEVEAFVKAIKPLAFYMLFDHFDADKRNVFNLLATLKPELILPELIEKLQKATLTLTEPLKFTACVATLGSCTRVLVETYPESALEVLLLLLPGIDVNDVNKCSDNFVLMSEILELIYLFDVSDLNHVDMENVGKPISKSLVNKTHMFEAFALEFTEKCLQLMENTRREQTRFESDNMEDTLNDDELTVDVSIAETFHKIVTKCSTRIFNQVFERLRSFVQGKILDSVSGSILASMCRSTVTSHPDISLKFFVPHLTNRLQLAVKERVHRNKPDQEIQFCLLLLSEIISIQGLFTTSHGASSLLPFASSLSSVFQLSMELEQKDEYEWAFSMLHNVIYNIIHIRPLTKQPSNNTSEVLQWAKRGNIKSIQIDWHVPKEEELQLAQQLINDYLDLALSNLMLYADKKKHMEKEDLLKHLRLVYKVVHGASELLPMMTTAQSPLSASHNIADIGLNLTYHGRNARDVVFDCIHKVQGRLLHQHSDDVDSLNAITSIFETLLFTFGYDEDGLLEHIDDFRAIKYHRLNHLIRNKQHLESIMVERVALQYAGHNWIRHILKSDAVPQVLVDDLFDLSTSHYSEVRINAQELLQKVLSRSDNRTSQKLMPKILKCLTNDDQIEHEMLKGALYILFCHKSTFVYSWDDALTLLPTLVKAHHSDKESIVALMRSLATRFTRHCDRDLALRPLSLQKVIPSQKFKALFADFEENTSDHDITAMIERLTAIMVALLRSKTLHWRQEHMAYSLLFACLVPNQRASLDLIEVALEALVHDSREVRDNAIIALSLVLKNFQPDVKTTIEGLDKHNTIRPRPGAREDNEFLQYRTMTEEESKYDWYKPWLKSAQAGFYTWRPKEKAIQIPKASNSGVDNGLKVLFEKHFSDEAFVNRYVDLLVFSHRGSSDDFSLSKAEFHRRFFQVFHSNPDVHLKVLDHLPKLAQSTEAAEQRTASEITYGLIVGSQVWKYEAHQHHVRQRLEPVLTSLVLNTITPETVADWTDCFDLVFSKVQPKRLAWLIELFNLGNEKLGFGNKTAFKESFHLTLVDSSMNRWPTRQIIQRTERLLLTHLDHPYDKVRQKVAKVWAGMHGLDIIFDLNNDSWHAGNGYGTKKDFLDAIIPHLDINVPIPVAVNGDDNNFEEHDVSNVENALMEEDYVDGDTMEVDMEEDEITDTSIHDETQQPDAELGDGFSSLSVKDRRSMRTLHTASLYVIKYLSQQFMSVTKDFYALLPYLCQFVGTETIRMEVGQNCLRALCSLSIQIVPASVIPAVLDMLEWLKQSPSWKAKNSMLEFLLVFTFSNFMSLCEHEEHVSRTKTIVLSLLSDENVQVRNKASSVLSALFQSHFLDENECLKMIQLFRTRTRTRMTRELGSKKFKKEEMDKTRLAEFHSGILGLCAVIDAYPFEVPPFIPELLVELERHLQDPQPIPKTIKATIQDFKRTHQEEWEEHKNKFTEDQLTTLTDLLIAPNYYA